MDELIEDRLEQRALLESMEECWDDEELGEDDGFEL